MPDCSDINAVYNYYLSLTGCPYQASYRTAAQCGHHEDLLDTCCGNGGIGGTTTPNPYYSYCYGTTILRDPHPKVETAVSGSCFQNDYSAFVSSCSGGFSCSKSYQWEGTKPGCPCV